MSQLIQQPEPSFKEGFARSRGESAHEDSWKHMIGAWEPALGVQGDKLWDVSGYGNDGTLTDMAPASDWEMSSIGYVLDYDASDDYVAIPDSPLWDVTQLTVSAWVNIAAVTAFPAAVGRTDNASGSSGMWMLGMGGSDSTFKFRIRGATARIDVQDGTGFAVDTWFHLTGTVEADLLPRLYIDGVLRDTGLTCGALGALSTPIAIGAKNSVPNSPWDGKIGGVRLFDHGLHADAVMQHYLDTLAPFREGHR